MNGLMPGYGPGGWGFDSLRGCHFWFCSKFYFSSTSLFFGELSCSLSEEFSSLEEEAVGLPEGVKGFLSSLSVSVICLLDGGSF